MHQQHCNADRNIKSIFVIQCRNESKFFDLSKKKYIFRCRMLFDVNKVFPALYQQFIFSFSLNYITH